MRVVIYRKSDLVVFWVGDSNALDYIEPAMRDDLQQALQPQPLPIDTWYKTWYVWDGERMQIGKQPQDADDVRLWRLRVVTLNMLAAAVNVLRSRVLPPLLGQKTVYDQKKCEAMQGRVLPMPWLETYMKQNDLTGEQCSAIVFMKDGQYETALRESENKREKFKRQIQEAANQADLEAIRRDIQLWFGQ